MLEKNVRLTENQIVLIATLCSYRKADLLEINRLRNLSEFEQEQWLQLSALDDVVTHAMREYWTPAEDVPVLKLVRDGKKSD